MGYVGYVQFCVLAVYRCTKSHCQNYVVPVSLTYGVSCTGCRSASLSASSSGPLHSEPSILAHRLTLRVSCIGINHWGHCALALLPLCSLHRPHASSDFHKHSFAEMQSLCRLHGTIYLLPSVILPHWLPSKLRLKHISSTPLTRHATIAIYQRLRFTFPTWHMVPTKEINVDSLIYWYSEVPAVCHWLCSADCQVKRPRTPFRP